jgi:kynurenine formamidase
VTGAPAFPTYEALLRDGSPAGTSWGLWGPEDEIGALNRVAPEAVAAAARLVRRGAAFPLDWGFAAPDPVLFGRGPIGHVVHDHGGSQEDHLDSFYTHAGTHWDALSHYAHPEHGYYNGRSAADVQAPDARNSIAGWAKHGVVGRFVLADVGRWRTSVGRPIAHAGDEAIALDDLRATLAWQDTAIEYGDILLVRLGWVAWYRSQDATTREALSRRFLDFTSPGLSSAPEMIGWIWDSGIAAVACDNPAVEALPFDAAGHTLHAGLKAALGVSLGELFALDDLAADCAQDGRYVGLLTSAPLNYTGATGSPANALALK